MRGHPHKVYNVSTCTVTVVAYNTTVLMKQAFLGTMSHLNILIQELYHMLTTPLLMRPEFCFAQATAEDTRRSLAATGATESPSLYPAGGTYYHPIAVSLLSNDGALIFYTIDGTEPNESSEAVSSGELIVMQVSGTLRAIAAPARSTFSAYSSDEVQATFVVYSGGEVSA